MVGVILAGGAGRRIGGGKPGRELAGRPLAAHAADAVFAVTGRVALVGKLGETLPALSGVELWDDEPPQPRHPAAGIAHALARARGEPVLVCGADMPFVRPADCAVVAGAYEAAGSPRVVVAGTGPGQLEPLLGVYPPAAADALRAGAQTGTAMRALVASLGPIVVRLAAEAVRSVNTAAGLADAERELAQPRSST